MVGLIKFPVGKGGMVTGVKLTVWFAADFALFLCVAGGSAAGVSNFLYNRTAILAGLPVAGLIRFPVGKGGVVTGVKLAIRFAADFALFRFGAGGGAAGVSSFLYNRTAIVASLPMTGLIKFPAGKGGMVTGIKLAVWFAADGALFLCGAGGSAAGVSSFLYNRTAICTLFHMMHSISGRFPRSAALMRAGDGRDGGHFFVVANAALSAFGSRFGDGRFLCDLPLAVGVGGFFYICAAN